MLKYLGRYEKSHLAQRSGFISGNLCPSCRNAVAKLRGVTDKGRSGLLAGHLHLFLTSLGQSSVDKHNGGIGRAFLNGGRREIR